LKERNTFNGSANIDTRRKNLSLFGMRRKRHKTKEQKVREKGRRSYRRGKEFEKKVYPFLTKKGFRVTKSRVHSRKREEFDGLATDKSGRTYGLEVKSTESRFNCRKRLEKED